MPTPATDRPSLPPAPGRGGASCAQCAWRPWCLPAGLDGPALDSLVRAFGARRRVGRGETLYRVGDAFCNLYAVRAGHFMSCRRDPSGGRSVTGFQMPGELLALDAIASGAHPTAAVALEDAEVCEIPYAALGRLLIEIPPLMEAFHRALSQEIQRDQILIRFLGIGRAEERLAGMLVNLSRRYALRGLPALRFRLRMSRDDIACYLGLKLETVSRLLGGLQRRGLIRLAWRELEIVDQAGLALLAREPAA